LLRTHIFEATPNPPLSNEQQKLIVDIVNIGQTIEDKEYFKKFLHHLFFTDHIVIPDRDYDILTNILPDG